MTADEVIRRLDLTPLPEEGGHFRQTWKSGSGTAIYFLLTRELWGFSALHSLKGVEIYHFYAGSPVQLMLFPPEGAPREVVLGNRLERGETPQCIVPAGVVQGSRLQPGGDWALLGTTMAPGYTQDQFRLSRRGDLLERYPDYREQILSLTREEISP